MREEKDSCVRREVSAFFLGKRKKIGYNNKIHIIQEVA